MSNLTPRIFTSKHRIKFSDLDPYGHMRTAAYPAYFVDHRMDALREQAGWDLDTIGRLPFMTFVRRLEIDFIRPVAGDHEVTITSFVREFKGPDASIECQMADGGGQILCKCRMVVAYVDKSTSRSASWPNEVMVLFFER